MAFRVLQGARKLASLATLTSNNRPNVSLPVYCFSTSPSTRKEAKVTFVMADGTKQTVSGKIGQNLLDIVVDNEVDIDGFGACEGSLACSTCHLIFKDKDFESLPNEPTEEELDMLDLAYGLTKTSRLGCQICLSKELDGLEVNVPEGVNDQR